ncbi:hypothetical protein ACFY5H_21645 [Streptomyces sp. NPDC013012]|uniref:hypothetical protein n=1 Tax=Streptomyces sp. NPDC013012 TaxID=3364860 RepID=UPI00369B1DFA
MTTTNDPLLASLAPVPASSGSVSSVPVSSVSVPAPCPVPAFEPVRVRGARPRLRGAPRRGRRVPVALLALMAAALAVVGSASGGGSAPGGARAVAASPARPAPAAPLVSAAVRIADAATVRLLRPGDRVDVIAAPHAPPGGEGGGARVVAAGARVTGIPQADGGDGPDAGALVVLSVPRSTAAALAGAGVTSRLAVTVC